MTRLPSSKKLIDVLRSHDLLFISQRGSHQKYSNGVKTVIVPAPRTEIPIGTIKSISKQSGIPLEEFLNL